MKKTLKLLLPTILLAAAATKPANALVSAYVGANMNSYKIKPSVTKNAPIDITEENSISGIGAGLVTGVELNLLAVKLGVEGFYEKALTASDSADKFSYYGIKGKVMMNLLLVEPYLALGLGREQVSDYKNQFGLIGLGVQGKIAGIGAFAEINYTKSLKSKDVMNDIISIKHSKTSLQIGLKYYFI